MDLSRKTEIIDNAIFNTLKNLHEEYNGDIQFTIDSNYNSGRIIIKVKE